MDEYKGYAAKADATPPLGDAATSARCALVDPGFNTAAAPKDAVYIATLSPQQLKVLVLLAEGLSNKQIAARLKISVGTVKIHVTKILRRFNVERRAEAIVIAQRLPQVRAQQFTEAEGGHGLLNLFLPYATHARYRAGDIVFHRGEQANHLFYVQQGVVAVNDGGGRVNAGELLGEVGLFSRVGQRTATARCETDVEVFALASDKAREMYLINPHFAMHVATTMAQRLSAARGM